VDGTGRHAPAPKSRQILVVAVMVGGIEALGLIQDQLNLAGPFWDGIGSLNDNFGTIGYLIIGVFVLRWIISAIIYRAKGYDRLDRHFGTVSLAIVDERAGIIGQVATEVVAVPQEPGDSGSKLVAVHIGNFRCHVAHAE